MRHSNRLFRPTQFQRYTEEVFTEELNDKLQACNLNDIFKALAQLKKYERMRINKKKAERQLRRATFTSFLEKVAPMEWERVRVKTLNCKINVKYLKLIGVLGTE